MPFCTNGANPPFLNSTVYVPADRFNSVYSPRTPEWELVTLPVCSSVAMTSARETAPSLESRTTPLIVLRPDCADASPDARTTATAVPTAQPSPLTTAIDRTC